MFISKIIILGQLSIDKKDVNNVFNKLNICPKSVEFVSYKEAVCFNYIKLKNSKKYSDIIVGPLPHKGNDIGEYSSIITMLERDQSFPNVIRATTSNELKLTKNSLINSLLKTNKYLLGL